METYTHTVQYYETDRMGITHHSNYIRWMEEARIDFLKRIGFGYDRLEKEGMISPVTAVECRYKGSTTFADMIDIDVRVVGYNGVVLRMAYVMTKGGKTVFEGKSEHCFLDGDGNIFRLKKANPALHEKLTELAALCKDGSD